MNVNLVISFSLTFFTVLSYVGLFLYARKNKAFLFDINLFTNDVIAMFLLFATPFLNLGVIYFLAAMLVVTIFTGSLFLIATSFFAIIDICMTFVSQLINRLKNEDFSLVR